MRGERAKLEPSCSDVVELPKQSEVTWHTWMLPFSRRGRLVVPDLSGRFEKCAAPFASSKFEFCPAKPHQRKSQV